MGNVFRAGLGGCVLVLAASCDSGTMSGPKDSGPLYSTARPSVTVAYGIAGYAVYNGAQIYLAAAKMSDGSVSGAFVAPLAGPVVELVRPTPAINYWCVNVLITNEPTLTGFNYLWYIRDIGNGITGFDELAMN